MTNMYRPLFFMTFYNLGLDNPKESTFLNIPKDLIMSHPNEIIVKPISNDYIDNLCRIFFISYT